MGAFPNYMYVYNIYCNNVKPQYTNTEAKASCIHNTACNQILISEHVQAYSALLICGESCHTKFEGNSIFKFAKCYKASMYTYMYTVLQPTKKQKHDDVRTQLEEFKLAYMFVTLCEYHPQTQQFYCAVNAVKLQDLVYP